jgi:hypothetical protein
MTEQGVSITPEGILSESGCHVRMTLGQRSLVSENLKRHQLELKVQQRNAAEIAACTFAPKTKQYRNSAGKQIKSKIDMGGRSPLLK